MHIGHKHDILVNRISSLLKKFRETYEEIPSNIIISVEDYNNLLVDNFNFGHTKVSVDANENEGWLTIQSFQEYDTNNNLTKSHISETYTLHDKHPIQELAESFTKEINDTYNDFIAKHETKQIPNLFKEAYSVNIVKGANEKDKLVAKHLNELIKIPMMSGLPPYNLIVNGNSELHITDNVYECTLCKQVFLTEDKIKAHSCFVNMHTGRYFSPDHLQASIDKAEGKKPCDHTWKSYMGLSESYEYCTICDEKR